MPFMEIRLFSMEGFPLKQAKNKKELYVLNENYSIFFVFAYQIERGKIALLWGVTLREATASRGAVRSTEGVAG